MDIFGWMAWGVTSALWLAWSLVWFLLGGWVSTLAQIAVMVLLVFGYKHGWRRAPRELMTWLSAASRFAWGWLRSSGSAAPPVASRSFSERPVDRRRRREPGDVQVNVSTVLSLLMIAGLWALAGL